MKMKPWHKILIATCPIMVLMGQSSTTFFSSVLMANAIYITSITYFRFTANWYPRQLKAVAIFLWLAALLQLNFYLQLLSSPLWMVSLGLLLPDDLWKKSEEKSLKIPDIIIGVIYTAAISFLYLVYYLGAQVNLILFHQPAGLILALALFVTLGNYWFPKGAKNE